MTEDEARKLVEEAVAETWGGEPYRGYLYRGIGWRQSDYSFRAYAFMSNSPLHPKDGMYVDGGVDVKDWREYEHCGSCDGANAALSLKRLIDKVYEDPGYFERGVEAEVEPEVEDEA